jgi:hypothetical protein
VPTMPQLTSCPSYTVVVPSYTVVVLYLCKINWGGGEMCYIYVPHQTRNVYDWVRDQDVACQHYDRKKIIVYLNRALNLYAYAGVTWSISFFMTWACRHGWTDAWGGPGRWGWASMVIVLLAWSGANFMKTIFGDFVQFSAKN